jgi:hypothetical protein
MTNELRTEVEQVKQKEDVKRALRLTSTVKPGKPKAETKDRLLLGTHVGATPIESKKNISKPILTPATNNQ